MSADDSNASLVMLASGLGNILLDGYVERLILGSTSGMRTFSDMLSRDCVRSDDEWESGHSVLMILKGLARLGFG